MEELNLHSQGQRDHLVSISEKYKRIKKALKANASLTKIQKKSELEKNRERLKKEIKDSDNNLY